MKFLSTLILIVAISTNVAAWGQLNDNHRALNPSSEIVTKITPTSNLYVVSGRVDISDKNEEEVWVYVDADARKIQNNEVSVMLSVSNFTSTPIDYRGARVMTELRSVSVTSSSDGGSRLTAIVWVENGGGFKAQEMMVQMIFVGES